MVDISQLGAIDEDVPFDHGTANALISAFNSAASEIEGQSGSRASFVTTAMNEFKGFFSQLFSNNASVASSDATELASRLREVATGAGKLAEEARKEQQRRQTARDWKRRQDARNGFDKFVDGIFGGEDPPVGPPAAEPTIPVSQSRNGTRETPQPGNSGGGGGGTSSARPADLRSFATGSQGLNDGMRWRPGSLRGHLSSFASNCRWGTLSADGVMTGYDQWLSANDQDVLWANTVANAFAAAGGEGNVSSLPNSALAQALQAANVSATRQDLVIQPPQAYGHPPTTGYADDPVNTATGNFVETEVDLGFAGASSSLTFARTYNALTTDVSALGMGWTSIVDQKIELDDEGATWTLPDGRRIIFPRAGEGWDRAPGENLWLTKETSGLTVTDNNGGQWRFSTSGQWISTSRGHGTTVSALRGDDGALTRLNHERGRFIELLWTEDQQRLAAVRGSDGRTVEFSYNESGQLIGATSAVGTRSYEWNSDGIIQTVTAADGVREVENSYDADRRVSTQVSQFGRQTRYAYLPSRTTVVSDMDGERANTWIADQKGRLVGIVDTNDQRQSMSYDEFGNLVSVTGRDGSVTVHAYDDRGRRIRTLTPSTADITYGYDELDRVTTVVAASGGVTEYVYEGENRNPSVIIDPMGGRTQMRWDGGLLTKVEDPTGVTLTYDYDQHGDLVATTNALGHTARLERDDSGRVTAAISPMGARTSFRYNAAGVLESKEDALGSVWRYEHTKAGKVSAIIDPLGARTELEYGPHGELIRTVDPLGRVVTRSFDDLGNVAAAQLPDGSQWRFEHDGLSRMTAMVDPAGGEWTRQYGADGNLTGIVDPTGVSAMVDSNVADNTVSVTGGVPGADALTSSTRFDPLGRPVASTGPGGEDELVTYDLCGRPVELVDAEGGLTLLRRDAAGRVVERISPMGATVRYEYDVCGRLERVTDAEGGVSVLEYDGDSRLVSRTSPTGEVAWAEYDKTGRVTSRFTPGHGMARFAHDALGRVTWSQDSWFGTRKFRYDAAGQLVETVNGNGGVTRFEYDELSRLVRITDPVGGVTTRTYNALNKVVSVTDPLGRVTEAGYDAAGRQVSQTDADGRRTEWGFDGFGRQRSVSVNGRLVSSVERDVVGRKVVVTDNSGPDGSQVEHELEWNRRNQLVRRARGGRAVSWEYDADGFRTRMTSPDGLVTSYSRNLNGLTTAVENERLGRATFSYDGSGRLVEAGAGDVIQKWSHREGFVVSHQVITADGGRDSRIERDSWGRVVRVVEGERVRSFGYDQACQLIEERVDGSGEAPGEAVSRWVFDAAGRLVSEVDAGTGEVREHSYDAASQLVLTAVGGVETRFAYNGAGNRTRAVNSDGSSREYEWADTGWLAGVVDRDASEVVAEETSLWVDATGELARIDTDEVFWDTARGFALSLVQAGDRAVTTTPGGFTGVDGEWSVPGWRSARGNDADPWDVDPIASLVTGDTAGGVGVGVGAAGELLFAGMEWMGARVYDSGTRGFLSVDPLSPVLGSGWSGNPYAFAGNDPVHALDPSGLSPVTEAELKAYADSNNGVVGAVGSWVADNWEYLAGGAMVIAGGVLMATGVGGPAGMMLISAGADTIIQKATTGEVNWGQVAISGAFGAWGGVGAAARLGAKAGLQQIIVGGMISGGSSGFVGGGYSYLTGPGPHTPGGFLGAAGAGLGSGAVLGGASSAAGHGLGALGNKLLPKPGSVLDDLTPNPAGGGGASPNPGNLTDEARKLMGNPGDTVVLGRLDDTAVAKEWPEHVVLQTDNWSLELNDEFIRSTIDYQRPVYLGSPIEGNMIQTSGSYAGQPTIYARELSMLYDAGYTMHGDYLLPPGS